MTARKPNRQRRNFVAGARVGSRTWDDSFMSSDDSLRSSSNSERSSWGPNRSSEELSRE